MKKILWLLIMLANITIFAGEEEDYKKTKGYCEEKSHKLCIDNYKAFEKANPKSKYLRELKYFAGVANLKLYYSAEAIKYLGEFINDSTNDLLKGKALLQYADTIRYYYGMYDKTWSDKIFKALETGIPLVKGSEFRKEALDIMINVSSAFTSNYYYQKGFKEQREKIEGYLKALLKEKNEYARYYYTIGYNYYYGYYGYNDKVDYMKKAEENFLLVIKEFPDGDYYADCVLMLNYIYSSKQDFKKALAILEEAKKKLSITSKRFYEIGNAIAAITNPQFSAYTNYTFLPNNKPVVTLSWRNVNKATIKIYKVENVGEYIKKYTNSLMYNLANIAEKDKKLVKEFKKDLKDEKDYKYHSEILTLDVLPSGLYILEGTSEKGTKGVTTINVTEQALVIKLSPDKGMVYVANAITGIPVANANVVVTLNRYDYTTYKYVVDSLSGKTDDSGVYTFDIKFDKKYYYSPSVVAVSEKDGNTAFSNGYGGYYYWNYYDNYSSYSYTDRPAYRPGETVNYKAIIRLQKDGEYKIPDEKFTLMIYDPKGQKLEEKEVKLDEFGTLSGSIETKKDCPLGQYVIYIMNQQKQYIYRNYGYFRVEEYKLPEFNLTIKANQNLYKPGDKIKVEIDTQYYFGGAVKDAEGEAVVFEQPYYHYYYFPREYYWYYNNWQQLQNPYAAYGSYKGTELKRYKIKTDEKGKAYIEVQTKSIAEIEKDLEKIYGTTYKDWIKNRRNKYYGYYGYDDYDYGYRYYDYYYYYYNYYYSFDKKYHIEVKLTDKSRREIEGYEDIKVTQNPFYLYLRPDKYVYMPKDNINLEIKSMNANGEPVEVEGELKISQSIYNEKEKKYEYKLVKTQGIFVAKKDKFIHKLQIDKEGYYLLTYEVVSEGKTVTGSTSVYISNDTYAQLYRDQNLEIIPDKEYYKPNEKAKILITSKFPDSYVLLTIEGETLYKHQIEYIKEGSKIVYIQLDERMTPNVSIKGSLITNLNYFQQEKEIIVPPMDKFITVSIEKEKEVYKPGEEATFKIKTLNYKGEPIKANVSLGVVDASVYYIQPDYAPDILQFYYSNRKQMSVTTNHSFVTTQYYNKDKGVNEKLTIDQAKNEQLKDSLEGYGDSSGGVGGIGFKGTGSGGGGSSSGYGSLGSMSAKSESKPRMSKGAANKKSYDFADDTISGELMNESESIKEDPTTGNQQTTPNFENVKVRENFATTAYWSSSIVTNEKGEGIVKVKMPENLTQWKLTARSVDKETRVGEVKESVRTKKTVLVRLQAPRFFMERDRVTISGNIHNYGNSDGKFDVKLEVKGGLKEINNASVKQIEIKAGEDKRVDYEFDVKESGEAEITLFAMGKEGDDAMKMKFPVKVYGSDVMVSITSNTGDKTKNKLTIPEDRIKGATKLTVNISPSIAAIMIQSLEYLAQYPYGCVEQTMSRFLPTLMAIRAIQELNLDPSLLKKDVDKMVEEGLKRLYDFQLSTGGWGWWKDDRYNQYMTAYVVYGLLTAQSIDAKVKKDVLDRGLTALENSLKNNENDIHTEAYALYSLSFAKKTVKEALNRVYEKRDKLNSYSKALLAIAMQNLGETDKAKVLLRNMEDHVKVDKENKTAYYGERDYWYWYNGDVESTSFALRAYLLIDKNNERVNQLLKWLIYNRNGNRWMHTKDTANAVYALTDYLRTFKELKKQGGVQILVNGKLFKEISFNSDEIMKNINGWNVILEEKDLQTGENTFEIKKTGKEDVYYSLFLEYFSQEEHIKSSGFEVFVERKYKKIVNENNKTTFVDLKEGDILQSGDRVEVDLMITSKNHYQYIIVDDYKPAGMEPTRLTSGSSHAGGTYANMEVRDDKTVFFVTYLNQGKHNIKYELRAEIPGIFHSMPTKVEAMYVPKIKGNSDSTILKIKDK